MNTIEELIEILDTRAANFARELGVNLRDLLSADANRLRHTRLSGPETLKEISRALMLAGFMPIWQRDAASLFSYPDAVNFDFEDTEEGRIEKGVPSGWTRITSGYCRNEYWMLERAIISLEAGKIPWLIGKCAGELFLFRRGGAVLSDEEAA